MDGRLKGKIALVTGASRGIGRGIAERLGGEGAFVIVHYGQNKGGADSCALAICDAGGEAVAIGADVREDGEIRRLFSETQQILGDRKIDILVNNAGIGGVGGIKDSDPNFIDNLFATNVRGTVLVTKYALEQIRDGGRIITISSMVSFAAYPSTLIYAMTKAALNSFVRSLAVELAPRGITVNGVAPGATATDFIGAILADAELSKFYANAAALGRLGEPDDIAATVAFLASDDGRWITGQVIQASGGMHL
jgi:3-oxoacyl-[acyl-carrier protein] reductase